MITDWFAAQTSLFSVMEPLLLAHGILNESEHHTESSTALVSQQSFDLLDDLIDLLARDRAAGRSTLRMLNGILDHLDDFPNDLKRRQRAVTRLVEAVHEEIVLCGRLLVERLTEWKANGSPGGAAAGEAMIAEAQNPLKELLTEILQRPEVNLSP
jgi:hypothetical protein